MVNIVSFSSCSILLYTFCIFIQDHYEHNLSKPIVERVKIGCFPVPVVFGTVLIHLSSPYSENLVYHPPHPRFVGRVNDVLQFAFSAQIEG